MLTKKGAAPTAADTPTYAELQAEIQRLQAQAEALRRQELASVVAAIKEQIVTYGLTAADLGFTAKAPRLRSVGARSTSAAFADGQGNTWVGRGKRPQWVRDALAAGKSLDELRVR